MLPTHPHLEAEDGRIDAVSLSPLVDSIDVGKLEDTAILVSRAV